MCFAVQKLLRISLGTIRLTLLTWLIWKMWLKWLMWTSVIFVYLIPSKVKHFTEFVWFLPKFTKLVTIRFHFVKSDCRDNIIVRIKFNFFIWWFFNIFSVNEFMIILLMILILSLRLRVVIIVKVIINVVIIILISTIIFWMMLAFYG